jgi:hypothetical protein
MPRLWAIRAVGIAGISPTLDIRQNPPNLLHLRSKLLATLGFEPFKSRVAENLGFHPQLAHPDFILHGTDDSCSCL